MKVNAITSIPTNVVKKMLKNELRVEFDIDNYIKHESLERKLILLGNTTLQNKIKHYFKKNPITEKDFSREINLEEDFTEEDKRFIEKKVIDGIVDCCEKDILNNIKTDDQLKDAIRKAIIEDCTTDEEQIKNDVYTYRPTEEHNTDRGKTELKQKLQERLQKNGTKNVAKRTVERLLTEQFPNTKFARNIDQQRRDRIMVAYLLGMNFAETNTFLKKYVFTYGFDYRNLSDVIDAYILNYETFQENDSKEKLMLSREEYQTAYHDYNYKETEKNVKGKKIAEFKEAIYELQIDKWISEYKYWKKKSAEADFLATWAWKRFVFQNERIHTRKAYERKTTEKVTREMEQELSEIYQQLKVFAEQDGQNTDEELSTWISFAVLNKEEQFMEFVCSLQDDGEVLRITDDNKTVCCMPIFKNDWKNDIQPEKLIMYRHYIIIFAIELGLSWEGVDYLLKISDFHELYVKDFYEKALCKALYKHTQEHGTLKENYWYSFLLKRKEGLISEIREELEHDYEELTGYQKNLQKFKESEARLKKLEKEEIYFKELEKNKVYKEKLEKSEEYLKSLEEKEPYWVQWIKEQPNL